MSALLLLRLRTVFVVSASERIAGSGFYFLCKMPPRLATFASRMHQDIVKTGHNRLEKIMIDRTSRRRLGELLRHFVAGRVDNFSFEEKVEDMGWKDAGVGALALESWELYDDFQKHALTGKWKMDKDDRRIIARWILFLQSDLEYEWPFPTIKHNCRRIATVLTCGFFPAFREPAYPDLGSYEVWPFFRMEDYEAALRSPKLLRAHH